MLAHGAAVAFFRRLEIRCANSHLQTMGLTCEIVGCGWLVLEEELADLDEDASALRCVTSGLLKEEFPVASLATMLKGAPKNNICQGRHLIRVYNWQSAEF